MIIFVHPSSCLSDAGARTDQASIGSAESLTSLGWESRWRQPRGGVSDTSSSGEEEVATPPPYPIVPTIRGDSELLAIWDLISRPDGRSIRSLWLEFSRRHGPPSRNWLAWLYNSPYFELYLPHRRTLPHLRLDRAGRVHVDAIRHVNAMVIRRRHHQSMDRSEVERLASWVADGGSVHLVPSDDMRDASLAGARVRVRAVELARERREASFDGSQSPSYSEGTRDTVRATLAQQRCHHPTIHPFWLPVPGWGDSTPVKLPDPWRPYHVRRAPPPSGVWDEGRSEPSERLSVAMAKRVGAVAGMDVADAVVRTQPLAFAGAQQAPVLSSVQAPTAFSHRRFEPMPDAERLVYPYPVANTPPVRPRETPPPADPPEGLVAYSVGEVVPRRALRWWKTWAKRADRCITLASHGEAYQAKNARPTDLTIDARLYTHERFRGVIMDFTSFPFKPLLPSRWPDRPPRGDIDIRAFRREFRSHPAYPDRCLRSSLSHGNPEIGRCPFICHFACPHTSALKQASEWRLRMDKEVDNGWARDGFTRSYGLASWPQLCSPTSMQERHGSWRMCHDYSWPKEHPDVMSPNAADYGTGIMIVSFMRLSQLAMVISIMRVAGVPLKCWKGDLSKAYKRTGQQNAAQWRRTCYGPRRSQTQDVICFGQADGPAEFSSQTHFMVYIIDVEIEYADSCYPTKDPALVAYLHARRAEATAQGLSGEAARSWERLAWVMAMIDDFGGISFDDLLYRVDGSVVLDERGYHKRRATLHFEVFQSIVTRLGHRLDPSEPLKYTAPDSRGMLLLGVELDLETEELMLEERKRVNYALAIREAQQRGRLTVTALTSLAFRMLVVCEVRPTARQWLHPMFRALRGQRMHPIDLEVEVEVAQSLKLFHELLTSSERIAVPMACRESFPFADCEALLVGYADASGPVDDSMESLVIADGDPGFGAWCVRGSMLLIIHGLWSERECSVLSISVLEYLISTWMELIWSDMHPNVSHILSFTDNTGAEWSSRREAPSAQLMQRVAAYRAEHLRRRNVFVRTERVTSAANTWADDLSRQRPDKVVAEASALGLRVQIVAVPDAMRCTRWLTGNPA